MGLVPLDNLEEGMVLASDVKDRTGRMLLGAGAELNQKHLVIFRTWGVAEADIAGVDGGEGGQSLPAELTQEMIAEAEKTVLPLFCNTDIKHPVITELLRIAVIRKAQNVST